MTTKQKILSCYGFLTAPSISKICGVRREYVYQLWKHCDLPTLKDENIHIPKRKLRSL